ncbi:MAG: S9 family peptidase, partial [Pedobacter sp.]
LQEASSVSPKANYQLASRFSPAKIRKMVYSTAVDPHWLKLSNRFWYEYETPNGKEWYLVDPATKSKKKIFDNAKLAAEITTIVRDPFDAQHLPLLNLKFSSDEKAITFEVNSTIDELKKDRKDKKAADSMQKKVFYFNYVIAGQKLTEIPNYTRPKAKPNWGSVAPDSSAVIFSKNYNLYWMDRENYKKAVKNEEDSTIVEHQLTKDGVKFYAYGSGGEGEDDDAAKNIKKRRRAFVLWSPNSKHFVLNRTDSRKVKELWVINNVAPGRPTLETYKYQMPGEKESPIDEILLFNFAAKSFKKLDISAFKDQSVSLWSAPSLNKDRDNEFRPSIWLGNNSKIYFSRTSRDLKRIDVCTVDINTEKVNMLIDERFNTYVEINRPGLVNDGNEIIHWSERDGWGHFYLFDANGKLKNQITKGPFHTESIVNIDQKNRVLYFTANGREAKEDPYYYHLYRINFDGSGLKLLNAGDFDHSANMNDEGKFFVNNSSRVNTAPKSVLMDNTGKIVMNLETTDLSFLLASGYKFPEPFKVKADDGVTDIYGVMYKPFDFDPNKKYPIIEYVYPGPQTEAVNKSFTKSMDNTDRLAQLGYIVISVGNRGGNPARSKWYHTFGYGNLRDYGLADKKAAVEQLADRYKFIDATKVGITGHSGGGFMSTAAMLVYPDFFKVAVSKAGNHDNSIYNRWWSEKHHGVKEIVSAKGDTTFTYDIDKNPQIAKNLKGHLMIMTGDIDNNVHPANTIRLANALMKEGKRFEFVILPGQRHSFGDLTEYAFWKLADHFNRYLIGDFETPDQVDIVEIDREIERKR